MGRAIPFIPRIPRLPRPPAVEPPPIREPQPPPVEEPQPLPPKKPPPPPPGKKDPPPPHPDIVPPAPSQPTPPSPRQSPPKGFALPSPRVTSLPRPPSLMLWPPRMNLSAPREAAIVAGVAFLGGLLLLLFFVALLVCCISKRTKKKKKKEKKNAKGKAVDMEDVPTVHETAAPEPHGIDERIILQEMMKMARMIREASRNEVEWKKQHWSGGNGEAVGPSKADHHGVVEHKS
ncbi:hypothetical protein BHM03_00061608 [Ensete ventricosum]|nr:hypothetical protein BHM03_00061608 [Ensete ventricosum]